ncbi:MAG: [Fe-Fe] hydrogenase large subunit C-terminal domain-containing protein [Ruminococcus callidus]
MPRRKNGLRHIGTAKDDHVLLPRFVNLIRLHYPDLLDHISTTVSPMCCPADQVKRSGGDHRLLVRALQRRAKLLTRTSPAALIMQ